MIDMDTYLNRITSQHKTKPKFMAFLAARLQPFIDLAKCLESFDVAFDLDTAVGKQLDRIGQYIGVDRLLNFQPQYAPALLPDSYYRMLLKARISLNNWDGTTAGIQTIWGAVFPDYTIDVVDKQNMTMSVRIEGLRSLFESEIVNHGYLTPKPMGVLVDYSVIFKITLDTTLYAASFLYDRFLNKTIPTPIPPNEVEIGNATLSVGGLITTRTVHYSLVSANQ